MARRSVPATADGLRHSRRPVWRAVLSPAASQHVRGPSGTRTQRHQRRSSARPCDPVRPDHRSHLPCPRPRAPRTGLRCIGMRPLRPVQGSPRTPSSASAAKVGNAESHRPVRRQLRPAAVLPTPPAPPTALPHPRPGPRYPLIGDHDIQQIRRALHAAPGRHYPPVPLVIKVTAQAHQSSPSMP